MAVVVPLCLILIDVFLFEDLDSMPILKFGFSMFTRVECWWYLFYIYSGTRYGASLRKQIKKMEVSQHSKYFCEFCGKVCNLLAAYPYSDHCFTALGFFMSEVGIRFMKNYVGSGKSI